jgi:fumarate reductase flavoprotein subunit
MEVRIMAKTANKTLKANIVIIGGGGSGLSAAAAALEKGAKNIVILEKFSTLGGNAVSVSGIFAADTDMQRRMCMDAPKDDVFKFAMQYAHWKINGPLVRALVDKSADTVRWLESKGLNFVNIVSHCPNQSPNTYLQASGPTTTGSQLVKALSKECQDSSEVRIFCDTQVKQILTANKGKIAGVIANAKDGGEIRIESKSVIVCTGGFGHNEALLKKYDPSYNKEEVPPRGIRNEGDGIRMASEIGAALDGMVAYEWEEFFFGSRSLTHLTHQHNTLWVNKKGKRFTDEGILMMGDAANAIGRQPGRMMYCLLDEKIKEKILSTPLTHHEMMLVRSEVSADAISTFPGKVESELKRCAGEGKVKISSSLDEIARWMGVEPMVLKNTVDEYNSFCDRGHDAVFVKNRLFLTPLRNPPYYALKCGVALTTTHGGIKINERMEALNKEDEPIPGLYAAGVETGATDWDSYNMWLSGHSFGFTINSGRIAGEEAAEYVAK